MSSTKEPKGNFLKGVVYVKFEGVVFKDYTLLINFILNFDEHIKISPKSISNIKNRKLPYKYITMTFEIEIY